jgi:hypothetical protein
MLLRGGLILAFIVGVGIFAYELGSRLSDEAVMTLIGVTCGIVAVIPVSIGLLIALTRPRVQYEDEYLQPYQEPAQPVYPIYRPPTPPMPQQPQQPQIIVVAPPQTPMNPNYMPYSNYLLPPQVGGAPPMQERNFKIVGEDEGE